MKHVLAVALLIAGCASSPNIEEANSNLGSGPITSPYLLASYPAGLELDGIAGDERLLFATITNPVPGRTQGVIVAHRLTGQFFSELPAPPTGWHFPAFAEVESFTTSALSTSGTVLIIDNSSLPPFSHMILYRYGYSYTPAGGFTATLLSTHELPLQPLPPTGPLVGIVYAGGLAILPDGGVVISDAFLGTIWACSSTLDDCHFVMVDPDFGIGPAPPINGIGRAPGGGTQPYTLTISVGVLPGIIDLTYVAPTDEVCTLRTAAPGGLFCVDRATLLSTTVPPNTKAKRVLVAPTNGLSDLCHGVKSDKYHPSSPWVYWIRSIADVVGGGSNVLRRVNVFTGDVQEVAESLSLIDFGTGISPLPPLLSGSPFTTIAIASGQEENNASLNAAISADQYVAPSPVAGVKLLSY